MYHFLLDIRIFLPNETDYPIKTAIRMLDECIAFTRDKDYASRLNIDKIYCTKSHKEYMQIYWFLKYFEYTQGEKNNFFKGNYLDENNLEQDIFIETSPFLIYMNSSVEKEYSLQEICKGHLDQQICLENKMYDAIKKKINDGKNRFSDIYNYVFMDNQEELEDRKYIIWNVFETLYRENIYDFQDMFHSYEKEGILDQIGEDIRKRTQIGEEDNKWINKYIRYNFATHGHKYNYIREAVQTVYDSGKLHDYLYGVQTYKYNQNEKKQVFHLKNVGMFLYFGHTDERYTKLVKEIWKNGWLIFLFKKGEFDTHDSLFRKSLMLDWNKGQNNEDRTTDNADKLLKFLQKENPLPDIIDNVYIDTENSGEESDSVELEKILTENRERAKVPQRRKPQVHVEDEDTEVPDENKESEDVQMKGESGYTNTLDLAQNIISYKLKKEKQERSNNKKFRTAGFNDSSEEDFDFSDDENTFVQYQQGFDGNQEEIDQFMSDIENRNLKEEELRVIASKYPSIKFNDENLENLPSLLLH